MPNGQPVVVSAAVEGPVDKAAAEKLIVFSGGEPGPIFVRGGKQPLLDRVGAYNNAARFTPWLVLVDLDSGDRCAPPARFRWLPSASPLMCFRIVVREIEAWFIADRDRLARFLRVPNGQIALRPEEIENPKEEIVRLASRSRSRTMRADIVPRPRSGRTTGPAYTGRMIEFAKCHWTPGEARTMAQSLERAVRCISRIINAAHSGGGSRELPP